jgi:hypothetical protein
MLCRFEDPDSSSSASQSVAVTGDPAASAVGDETPAEATAGGALATAAAQADGMYR